MKRESDFFMKFRVLLLILTAVFLVSCASPLSEDRGDAEQVLRKILSRFELPCGVVYSDAENAEYPLTDSLIERMFSDGHGVLAFEYVTSCAVYFSRHFTEHEIVVIKICDRSHREEVMNLCRRRAEKKQDAVVYDDGVYVYLICTDQNHEILKAIK